VRRSGRILAAVVAAAVLVSPVSVQALTWPIPVETYQQFGPDTRWDGAVWCGRIYNGSYGSSYFAQPQTWVNYGGVCNAAWGQPAAYIKARAMAMYAGTVIDASSWVSNSANSNWAQAQVAYHAGATDYWGLGSYNLGDGVHITTYIRDRT
jgi:hypothetical protein